MIQRQRGASTLVIRILHLPPLESYRRISLFYRYRNVFTRNSRRTTHGYAITTDSAIANAGEHGHLLRNRA